MALSLYFISESYFPIQFQYSNLFIPISNYSKRAACFLQLMAPPMQQFLRNRLGEGVHPLPELLRALTVK